jgi:murein DD-endopeptidase MepM/ murein hydrolase activator NlpD
MASRFKIWGARTLLLITKGFISLHNFFKKIPFIGATIRKIVRFFYLGTLYLLTPVYGLYRRAKRTTKRWVGDEPLTWIRPFTHRYLLHVIILIITLTTLYTNLRTPIVNAEGYGEGRLIEAIIGTDDYEAGLRDIPALPDYIVRQLEEEGQIIENVPPLTFIGSGGEAIFQPYLPLTEESVARRTKVETYKVEGGDTLGGIAAKFQIQLTTLLYANNLNSRSLIQPGQELTILPVDGLTHKIARNENIGYIANLYGVKSTEILSFNNINDPTAIQVGAELIIPGGKPPAPAPTPARANVATSQPSNEVVNIPSSATNDEGLTLLWPTTDHHINQYYNWRHSGLDIRGKIGNPIYAAEDGVVLEARWAGDYGKMVLIKHDNGLITRYGHNDRLLVEAGERITRGQTISLMGSTGRSTGPHLHFEVITNGARVNPLTYTR